MPTVLVIDDNPAVATALEVLFSLRDLRTLAADSPAAGLAVLAREPVDVVIQDMNFRADTTSGADGAALFRAIRGRFPDLPVILLTAWTQLESAVALVKAGAADYLEAMGRREAAHRSEERRVGKEGRCRGSAGELKKKGR